MRGNDWQPSESADALVIDQRVVRATGMMGNGIQSDLTDARQEPGHPLFMLGISGKISRNQRSSRRALAPKNGIRAAATTNAGQLCQTKAQPTATAMTLV